MGSSHWIDDDQIRRKRTPSFPSNESVLSRNAQKQSRWKIIFAFRCRWWYDWNFFSHNMSVNQLSIYGAVSALCEEYSSCQTRTGKLVVAEQSDPLFAPADLFIMTPTPSIEILAQENLLQKHKDRVEKLPQPDQLLKNCIDAGFLTNSWSRTVFHDRSYWRVLTICRASDMSWVYASTRRQFNWPERLDSREHQNSTRVGSHNQLLARKNMEWKLELNL